MNNGGVWLYVSDTFKTRDIWCSYQKDLLLKHLKPFSLKNWKHTFFGKFTLSSCLVSVWWGKKTGKENGFSLWQGEKVLLNLNSSFHECQLFSEKLFSSFLPQTNFNVSRYMVVMWGKQWQMTLFRPSNSMLQKKKYKSLKKLLNKVEFFLKNHENDLQFCKNF